MTEKHVYLVDKDLLEGIREDLSHLKKSLQHLKVIEPKTDGYLTADEFMKAIKVSRWKFNFLVRSGALKWIKRGRKFYVAQTEVQRYFNGELEVK